MWKSTDFLREIVTSHNDAGSVTFLYVCPHCGLFPIEDFSWCVQEHHPSGKRRPACGGQYDWREAIRVLTIQANCRPEDTSSQGTRATSRRLRQYNCRVEVACELAGEGERHRGRVRGHLQSNSSRKVVAALRQFIEVDNNKALVRQVAGSASCGDRVRGLQIPPGGLQTC